MLARVLSGAVIGIEAFVVDVEVDITRGLPSFSTVGLAEGAVRESKDRVKASIRNAGYEFPSDRITVNLAPADVKKGGTGFDLPMALGILAANGLVPEAVLQDYLVVGELSLDGVIRPIQGALSLAVAARDAGLKGMFVPEANAPEAAVVDGFPVYAATTLPAVVETLAGRREARPWNVDVRALFDRREVSEDFRDVRGQENVKRALEVAAAGGHHLLMIGSPGAGKTMLARRMSGILPDLDIPEALETSKIYSVSGLLPEGCALITTRPFRAPHHTISDAGLIGGGHHPKPGEVSLAHNGVLFLDELPEFRRHVLEVMRQPMEEGSVTIARAQASVKYPASFMLVAAMNPCPCGHLGDPRRECTCTPEQVHRYRSRISGPLLDRIDIHMEVPPVPYEDLSGDEAGRSSGDMLKGVLAARVLQNERFREEPVRINAGMGSRHLREHCLLDDEGRVMLERAVNRFGLSARAYARILKVARTVADLAASPRILAEHLAEAIQYRAMDRMPFS